MGFNSKYLFFKKLLETGMNINQFIKKHTIPLLNLVIGLTIGSMVFIIFIGKYMFLVTYSIILIWAQWTKVKRLREAQISL